VMTVNHNHLFHFGFSYEIVFEKIVVRINKIWGLN
jgi:hypothetical protein